jgi:hypothetical protein
MSTEAEVEQFLKDFKFKYSFYGVIYLQRDKNLKALIALEITAASRAAVLNDLKVQDFYKGPSLDYYNGPELWEFGKKIKQNDVYIKITMGQLNLPVICISFHLAERDIKYPFK